MADQLNVPFGTFIGKTKEGGEKKSRGILCDACYYEIESKDVQESLLFLGAPTK